MGFKYSFVDSAVYGTEDINDITRCLVGAGIAPFLAKDSYNALDLNSLTSALVEAGTSLDGCKCSVEDAGTEKMTAYVGQGIVFFESGVRLEVDEDGCSVAVTPNTSGYIYAHYSPALQKADIVFSAEYPEDGEYVVLARLGEDGSLKDERIFARSKIATLGKNVVLTLSFERVEPELVVTDDSASQLDAYILAKAPAIDLSKFNYALVYSLEYASYQIIDLTDADSTAYLQELPLYTINYAQVINNRLCVKQVGSRPNVPYVTKFFDDELLSYKIILV